MARLLRTGPSQSKQLLSLEGINTLVREVTGARLVMSEFNRQSRELHIVVCRKQGETTVQARVVLLADQSEREDEIRRIAPGMKRYLDEKLLEVTRGRTVQP